MMDTGARMERRKLTMSTASRPAPMLRPAQLNCSALYTAPANLMSTQTRNTASSAKMKPKRMMTIQPAAWAGSGVSGAAACLTRRCGARRTEASTHRGQHEAVVLEELRRSEERREAICRRAPRSASGISVYTCRNAAFAPMHATWERTILVQAKQVGRWRGSHGGACMATAKACMRIKEPLPQGTIPTMHAACTHKQAGPWDACTLHMNRLDTYSNAYDSVRGGPEQPGAHQVEHSTQTSVACLLPVLNMQGAGQPEGLLVHLCTIVGILQVTPRSGRGEPHGHCIGHVGRHAIKCCGNRTSTPMGRNGAYGGWQSRCLTTVLPSEDWCPRWSRDGQPLTPTPCQQGLGMPDRVLQPPCIRCMMQKGVSSPNKQKCLPAKLVDGDQWRAAIWHARRWLR